MQEEIEKIFRTVEKVKKENGLTQEVTVVAATKMVEAERINLLPSFGITIAGENRVQELLEKYDKVSGLDWHIIGALQTNKVKYIIDKVKLIHSVDRKSLADEIEKQAKKRGLTVDVLVEINVGGEASKSGVAPSEACELMEYVSSLSSVNLKGVMSVLPVNAPDELYKQMQEFSSIATEKYSAPVLSMGMSDSYRIAIEEGSTLVRVGRRLFIK